MVISPVLALMANKPSPLPAVIAQPDRAPVISASVAATVPTLSLTLASSSMSNVCPGVITGAVSFRSSTVMVKVWVLNEVSVDVARTVMLWLAALSLSSALFRVTIPVTPSMTNSPPASSSSV